MLADLDDEMTSNQSGLIRGQLITAAAFGGRVKDTMAGFPGPLAGVATFGTAAVPLKFIRRDWGAGDVQIPFFFITPAAASNPTTSMTVEIWGADNPDLVTTMTAVNGLALPGGGAPVVLSTRTFLAAVLTAGAIFSLPPLTPGFQRRYCGCKMTPNGGNATTGAWVVGFCNRDSRPQESVTSY